MVAPGVQHGDVVRVLRVPGRSDRTGRGRALGAAAAFRRRLRSEGLAPCHRILDGLRCTVYQSVESSQTHDQTKS